jgi:hypothetical protein
MSDRFSEPPLDPAALIEQAAGPLGALEPLSGAEPLGVVEHGMRMLADTAELAAGGQPPELLDGLLRADVPVPGGDTGGRPEGPPETLSDLFGGDAVTAELPAPGATDIPETLTGLLAHQAGADNQPDEPGDRRDSS